VEPGEDRPLFGGLFSHSNEREKLYRQAIEQSREQRRKLHLQLDPRLQRAAVARLTAEAVQRMRENEQGTGWFGEVTEEDIARARTNARRTVAENNKRTLRGIEQNVQDESRLFGQRRWERTIANVPRQFNIGFGGMFSQARGFLGGQAQGLLGQAQASASQMLETMRLNMAMREQTRMPAERLKDQLAELEGQRSKLNPDVFARRRRQLLLEGIGGLEDKPFMPLAATESRSLTRGVDQKPVDELKRVMQQESEKEQAELRKILEELKTKGKLDVVLR
jgi:hypothetical protein